MFLKLDFKQICVTRLRIRLYFLFLIVGSLKSAFKLVKRRDELDNVNHDSLEVSGTLF